MLTQFPFPQYLVPLFSGLLHSLPSIHPFRGSIPLRPISGYTTNLTGVSLFLALHSRPSIPPLHSFTPVHSFHLPFLSSALSQLKDSHQPYPRVNMASFKLQANTES